MRTWFGRRAHNSPNHASKADLETPPSPAGIAPDDSVPCAALLLAAIESAHTGQPVEVQEFLQRHLTAA